MNVLLLLSIVFALFIVVDIVTAVLHKIKRNAVRNISLSVLIVLTVFSAAGGIMESAAGAETEAKRLFTAYNYIIDGDPDKAAESVADISSVHADIVMLLADCQKNNYSRAFIDSDDLMNSGRLDDDENEQVGRLYELSRKVTGLSNITVSADEANEQVAEIARNCIELLKVDEARKVEYLSAFQREKMLSDNDYFSVSSSLLEEMLDNAPNDTALLKYSVKYYNAAGQYSLAEENARNLLEKENTVENAVLYSDVIAQDLIGDNSIGNEYIYNYDSDDADTAVIRKNDREIGDLLALAKEAEKSASVYERDSERYNELIELSEKYYLQADGIRAQRIINWLNARTPIFGDSSGTIDLQVSRLYNAGGQTDKAKEILTDLIKRSDSISDNSPIKDGLKAIKKVFVSQNASDEDISDAIGKLMQADVFLDDSVLNRGYSDLLNKVLKYERMSVFISRIDAENYPTVRVYLNVNGRKNGRDELANDFAVRDFIINDNGSDIPSDKVRQAADDDGKMVSIALVIDGSGSMDGSRIENAKKAVESCIDNLDPQTQKLSIVTYDNSSSILTPLTNDKDQLLAGKKKLVADGGTVISSGLLAGLDSLKDAYGTRAIILMTDGDDGSPETIDAAIAAAKEQGVAVFTVSTGGGDREYMENIAEKTGGTYMEALSDSELANVYTSLQNYIVNNYCFEYTVEDGAEANPRLLSVGLADYGAVSCRSYAYGGVVIGSDGCYICRSDKNTFGLYYAEPSMISIADAKYGIPVFLSAAAPADGIRLYINGSEVNGVKTVGNNIAFVLQGDYEPGFLDITVKLTDGTVKQYGDLISVSGDDEKSLTAQTIKIGGSSIYADHVKLQNNGTYRLTGNVVLDGFLYAETEVILSGSVTSGAPGRLSFEYGQLSSDGCAYAYVESSASDENSAGVKVLDHFSFEFGSDHLNYDHGRTSLELPGYGTVNASVELDGGELVYQVGDDYSLSQLQNNLNYAINNIGRPEKFDADTASLITGIARDNYDFSRDSYGIFAYTEMLDVRISREGISIDGEGYVNGYIGPLKITKGVISFDSSDADHPYTMTGTVDMGAVQDIISTQDSADFRIGSLGIYPDKFELSNNLINIGKSELSSVVIDDREPDGFDASVDVEYQISFDDEPYCDRIKQLIPYVVTVFDKIEFICDPDRSESAIKAYSSSDPEKYILLKNGAIGISISGENEYSMFGMDFGGRISGIAMIDRRNIVLDMNVDGHLDNSYYGIKYDGISALKITLPRNAYSNSEVYVTVAQDRSLEYKTTISGGIIIDNGFIKNAEDRQ